MVAHKKLAKIMKVDLIELSEKWTFGGYLYTSIVLVDSASTSTISQGLEKAFEITREHRTTKLIRGISAYHIVPIFRSENPEQLLSPLFLERPRYHRFATVYFPLLLDSISKNVVCKESFDHNTSRFESKIIELYERGVGAANSM